MITIDVIFVIIYKKYLTFRNICYHVRVFFTVAENVHVVFHKIYKQSFYQQILYVVHDVYIGGYVVTFVGGGLAFLPN